jgi:hypothetical protein
MRKKRQTRLKKLFLNWAYFNNPPAPSLQNAALFAVFSGCWLSQALKLGNQA